MAFPTTGVLDDFNRANGALGANWSTNPFNDGSSSLTIISNAAKLGSVGPQGDAVWWNVTTFPADQEVWIDLPTFWGTGLGEVGVFLRVAQPSGASSTGDGYQVFFTDVGPGPSYNPDLSYFRWDNGVATQLGSTQLGLAFTEGQSFGARMVGSVLQAYSGTAGALTPLGTSVSDSTYSVAGFIGFSLYEDNRTAVVNNFGGGSAVPAVPGPNLMTVRSGLSWG